MSKHRLIWLLLALALFGWFVIKSVGERKEEKMVREYKQVSQ